MRRALLLTLALGVIVNSQSPASSSQDAAAHTVEVINTLAHERPSETISISAGDLKQALAVDDLRTVRVRDEKTAADLLTQAIDTNDDGTFDELIFQADFAPRETRRFTLSVGERRIARKDEYRAYGRFNRERRDDFAWENDRVAHRMYGAALETWKQEPLTSSGLDVWVKRTPRLVINDWYMVDDYHRDTGEGADLYSVGRTRGCGGSGLWVDGKLYSAANFRNSRVLANGPLRVMFELMYEPFDAAGSKVTEMKRITLDAGHHLNRVEIVSEGGPPNAALAAGIRKNPGSLRADHPRRRHPAHLGTDQAGGTPRVCRHRSRARGNPRSGRQSPGDRRTAVGAARVLRRLGLGPRRPHQDRLKSGTPT